MIKIQVDFFRAELLYVLYIAGKNVKNVNDVDFDTNINRDMCMKEMFLFIDIKLRIVYKYIYLYHVCYYLHHLCAQ